MVNLKRHWIWISAAATFVICLIIILFSSGNDDAPEIVPDRHVNIYLLAGNLQTTSEEIEGYGFYTSSGNIVISARKRGGFNGQLTLVGGEDEIERTVKLDGVMNSYIFSELDTEQAYSIVCEGFQDCGFTISEDVSTSTIPLDDTMSIDLNLGEFTTAGDEIYKYAFNTNSSNIYVSVKNSDGFKGEILLWSVMNGGDYVRSYDVDAASNSCEFSKLRSSRRYQISCENLDGCEIVISAK